MTIKKGAAMKKIDLALIKNKLFKKSGTDNTADIPGHPVNMLIKENRAIDKRIAEVRSNLQDITKEENLKKLLAGINNLLKVDIHYLRKENLIFPYMEKYGIAAPPKVMWNVDDEIREELKNIKESIQSKPNNSSELISKIENALVKIEEMIFKEENIMLPMLLEQLTQEEWKAIANEGDEFGYLIENIPDWKAKKILDLNVRKENLHEEGFIKLPTGIFDLEQLTYMLNTLPFDITFKMELNPIDVNNINEPKKLLGMTPKFKTMYFDFEEGKGLPDHVHNGYASIFIYEGKVQISFESGEKFELNKGGYLAFDARVKHNVIAEIQSKVLVTISESLK